MPSAVGVVPARTDACSAEQTIPNLDESLVFSTDAIIEERVGAGMYSRFFETMHLTGDFGPLRECHRECQERATYVWARGDASIGVH